MRGRWLLAASLLAFTGCGGATVPAPEDVGDLPWPTYYQLAGERFQQGRKDEAVVLFYLGQLRGRIYVRCHQLPPDRDPALLASFNETLGRTINEYAGASPSRWAVSIEQALAMDGRTPNSQSDDAECRAEAARQRQGLGQLRQQILQNSDEIRQQRAANGLPNE